MIIGVASSGSTSSGNRMRAIMPTRMLPTANSGHSIGTPVRKKARLAVFTSRAATILCMAAMDMNQTGKIAKNQGPPRSRAGPPVQGRPE